MYLFGMLAGDDSEQFAKEVGKVLNMHFYNKLERQLKEAWNDGTLDQKKFDELRQVDFHAQMRQARGTARN